MNKLVWYFVLVSTVAYAQKEVGEAPVSNVPTDGFYNLEVAPSWIPYLNEDMTNVKIVDKNNKEVPYILRREVPTSYTQQFKPYEIIDKKQEKNCCTTLLLRNQYEEPINNISLSIRNAEVTKYATLRGSDDNENWYALKQHFTLSSINSANNTSEVKIVDFPLSNYTYYLLEIEDSTSAPINILSAGYYEVNVANGEYSPLSLQHFQQDSASVKKTYLSVVFREDNLIDRLELKVEGAPYFLRQASLYQKASKVEKGDTVLYFKKLTDFRISSKQNTVLNLNSIRSDQLQIVIENNDNPPLTISKVSAYQLNRYFTTWLKGGEAYTLKLFEKTMPAPEYDLAYFKDSISATVPMIRAGSLTVTPNGSLQVSPTYFTRKNLIWVAIILIIGIFGYVAIKMAREAGKDKSGKSTSDS